jgi:predicted O-methyltransferase YrrM
MMPLPAALETPGVRDVLERLRVIGETRNLEYSSRVQAREAELGGKLYGLERAQIGAEAPQAVAPEVGRILYALTIATRPSLIVEFGASLGVSTIYLASALHDLDSGELITTELIETKAQAAVQNLHDAGLATRVQMRTGDARNTLNDLDRPIDMLFLDGSNDLYLDILTLLEPHLDARSVIAADLSHGDPHHVRYRDYVNQPENGYLSVDIPIEAGLVISTRT